MGDQFVAIGYTALAMVLGGLLGLEREAANKSAGLRTHMLAAGAAALTMSVGRHLFDGGTTGDPARALQAVVTGIGFLGAGAIIVSPGAERVHGLTTAASLFFAATVGVAVGAGELVLGVITAGFALFTLNVIGRARHDPPGSDPDREP